MTLCPIPWHSKKSCGNAARLCKGAGEVWCACACPAWGWAWLREREKQGTEEGTVLSRSTRSNTASFYSNTRIIFSISHILTVATQHGAGVEGCISPPPPLFPFLLVMQKHTLTTVSVHIHKPAKPTNKKLKGEGVRQKSPFFFFPLWDSFVDVPSVGDQIPGEL